MHTPPDVRFVSVAAANFLPQLWIARDSLVERYPQATLVVVACDNDLASIVAKLDWIETTIVSWEEVVPPEARSIVAGMSLKQRCWSLAPSALLHTSRHFGDGSQALSIYIDADIEILKSVKDIVEDFSHSNADVFVTEHAYDPEFDQTSSAGRFCVQFLGAKLPAATDILSRWQDQCLQLDSTPSLGVVFGDQKYLDEWPDLYGDRLQTPSYPGWFLGPWNQRSFRYSDAKVFHFHGLRYAGGTRFQVSASYPVCKPVYDNLYKPYMEAFIAKVELLRALGYDTPVQMETPGLRTLARTFLGKARRTWWAAGGLRRARVESR